MATAGADGDSGRVLTEGGSDESYDWVCCQCENAGKTTEASAYCRDCAAGYCDPCLQVHNGFPAMKNHVVLTGNRRQDWGTSRDAAPGSMGPRHTCPDHDEEAISMYCVDDDAVCCPLCVALDHRNCEDVVYIPKVAADVAKKTDYILNQLDMTDVIEDLEEALDELEECKTSLDDTRNVIEEDIRDTGRHVIEHFKELEDVAISKLDEEHANLGGHIDSCVSDTNDMRKELDASMRELERKDISDTDRFITFNMSKKKIFEGRKVVHNLSDSMKHAKVGFNANPALDKIVEIASLGKVTKGRETEMYTLVEQNVVRLDTPQDHNESCICGIMRLCTGHILLSDQANTSLKLLDEGYRLVSRVPLPGRPSQIAVTNTDTSTPIQAAVAILEGSIQFVSVDKEVQLTKRIKMKHTCNGLVYHDGNLYISDSSDTVYVYTTSGKKLRKLEPLKDQIHALGASEDLALMTTVIQARSAATPVTGNEVSLVVADLEKGVVVIDLEGNHVTTIKNSDIGACYKAVPDNHGHVFVLDKQLKQFEFDNGGTTLLGTLERNARQFFLDTDKSVLYVFVQRPSTRSTYSINVYILGRRDSAVAVTQDSRVCKQKDPLLKQDV